MEPARKSSRIEKKSLQFESWKTYGIGKSRVDVAKAVSEYKKGRKNPEPQSASKSKKISRKRKTQDEQDEDYDPEEDLIEEMEEDALDISEFQDEEEN